MNDIFVDDITDDKIAKLAKYLAMTDTASREKLIRDMEQNTLKEDKKGKMMTNPRTAILKKFQIGSPSELSITN